MLKLFDYVITKTKEYQMSDCEGNKFCAGTNESRIKESISQFMIVHGLIGKGISVNFLYETIASYKGVFEPLRKQILNTPYDAADCELHAWCLLATADEFRSVAEAVGMIFASEGYITVSTIRKFLEMRGHHLPLAKIKYALNLMIGLGVIVKQDCSFVVSQKLIGCGDSVSFNLVDATSKAIKSMRGVKEDLLEGTAVLMGFFPFIEFEKLRVLSHIMEDGADE